MDCLPRILFYLSKTINNRGKTRLALDDKPGALKDFSMAIKLYPADALAHHNRATLLLGAKNYKEALADYNKAVQINPNDSGAYNNRGLARRYLGDEQGAIADFEKAIEINQNWGDDGPWLAYPKNR